MPKTSTPRTCEDACTRDATGYCLWCETYICTLCEMEVVATPATRCEHCHPLACPCEVCREWDTGGVPEVVGEEDTSAVQTVRTKYEPIGVDGLGDVRARRRAA